MKAKHGFSKKKFKINETFVDREIARDLYHKKLTENTMEYNVLMYYGIGGIGKSSLKKEIFKTHKESNSENIVLDLNLELADNRHLGAGILQLVESCNVKMHFKNFELAYALYFRKKNPSIEYGRKEEFVTENTLVKAGLNIFSLIDGGIVATASNIIEKFLRNNSNKKIDEDVKEELMNFDQYTILEIEDRLPMFLQRDLSDYVLKHPTAKILINFDTFEALNENVIEPIQRRRNERWIEDFIAYFDSETFPNLLITIFGRDKIEWDEESQAIIEQYQLEGFDEEYSKQYLNYAGINDEQITDAIVKSSSGYPFLLYLSLETYSNMINNNQQPTARDFSVSHAVIIERFIYNLDKETVDVIKLLAIPNYYNDKIFRFLVGKFNVSFSTTEFNQFNMYSFISEDAVRGTYQVHDIIRREIKKNTDDWLQTSIHKNMMCYYEKDVLKNGMTGSYLELFYHATRYLTNVADFNLWVKKEFESKQEITPLSLLQGLQSRGEQAVLVQIIEGIIYKYSLESITIEIVNIYIDIVHLGGDYQGAVNLCDKYLDKHTASDILGNEQLLKMSIRKIHHSMFYLPVDKLILDAEELLSKTDKELFPEEYNELLFLIGGNLGVLSGDLEYAEKWLEKSLEFAIENKFDMYIQRTIRKQAEILIANEEFEQANRLILPYLNVNSTLEEIDTRYKIYLMAVLGEYYRKQEMLEEAMKCYKAVESKTKENNLPGWYAHSLLAQSVVFLAQKKYSDSEVCLLKAKKKYDDLNQKWGMITSKAVYFTLQIANGNECMPAEIELCKKEAEIMNYRYNIEYADKLLKREDSYLQLFFL